MHLKSDFKPNILWENIVLIIHLKVAWRWFITCCKKRDLRRVLRMTGAVRWSIHKTRASCFLHLSLSFPALMTFACCCLRRKIPLMTFFRATEACGTAQYFVSCNSVCRKTFRGQGDVSVTLASKQWPDPRHGDLPLTYGGGLKLSWAPDGLRP